MLPRCHEVVETCLWFVSTRFPMNTPISSISRKLRKPQLESFFSICHSRFDLLKLNFCGHLQNILAKACAKFEVIWISFDLVLTSFLLWFNLLESACVEPSVSKSTIRIGKCCLIYPGPIDVSEFARSLSTMLRSAFSSPSHRHCC